MSTERGLFITFTLKSLHQQLREFIGKSFLLLLFSQIAASYGNTVCIFEPIASNPNKRHKVSSVVLS